MDIDRLLDSMFPSEAGEPELGKQASAAVVPTGPSARLGGIIEGLEKLAGLPVLAGYEAAMRATPKSVEAGNDLTALRQHIKVPLPEVPRIVPGASGAAKHATDERAALIERLRAAGIGKAAAATPAEPAPAEVVSLKQQLTDAVAGLKTLAEEFRLLEQASAESQQKVAALQARGLAEAVAQQALTLGYIEASQVADYARDIAESSTLPKLAAELRSAPPALTFGTVTDRPDARASQTPEQRVSQRLLRGT